MQHQNRRNFLQSIALGSLALTPLNQLAAMPAIRKTKIRFGICTDVHQDIMHDGEARLKTFIEDMKTQQVDFIIQLGDFCRPYEKNLPFMNIWNSFPGPKYHVIGNHDNDGGFTHEQVIAYWKANGAYYSFDQNGYHFVILNGNEKNPSKDRPPGYARYIGVTQQDWLEKDLETTTLPTIVCCHQGLDNDMGGIENATQIRLILERSRKVQLVFSGHHHLDYVNEINGIFYVQINSMSYQWLGDGYERVRYGREIDEKYPWIKYTVPYKDPIYTIAEIDHRNNFYLKGASTSFVGPSPKELGMTKHDMPYEIVPYISERKIKLV